MIICREMKITYLPEGNILAIKFGSQTEVAETIERQPRVFVDIDKAGKVIGFERWEAKAILERAKVGFEIQEQVLSASQN
jgi:uncharacterized protein YuzE